MMKILCVAEKPSIAKAVAQILSGGQYQSSNTRIGYIKNYKFSCRFPEWGQCDVVFTSVAGHLTESDFEAPYNKWGNCQPTALFEAPIVSSVPNGQKGIYDNIVGEGRNARALFIWTDCDREGEHIGSEIELAAKKGNPQLQVKRAKFNNLEQRHIIHAAQHPVALDYRQAAAVNARLELDLRIGAAFTRFQTYAIQGRFREFKTEKKVISYGSCQFPALGFVVDRWKRVENFVPEPFWTIKLVVLRDEIAVKFTWKRNHLFDRLCCLCLYEMCLEKRMARVASVITKPRTKWKPLPLTTVELQKQGARFLCMSSAQIMSVAEKLYTSGFISYPRTETDQFDPGMNLQALVEKQVGDANWGNYAQSLLNGRYHAPRNGRNNDKAHPPIHPIAHVAAAALQDLGSRKVYEFVVRRFLACCSDDARGQATTVDLDLSGERFSVTGLVVLERNYLDVYPYDKWTSSQPLPQFTQGEMVMPTSLEMVEGKTSSPQYLTEPELIALMDANGIGTDATMAEHIQKIQDRQYVYGQPKTQRGRANDEDGEDEDDEDLGRRGGRGRGGGRGGAQGGGRGRRGAAGGGGIVEFVPSTLGIGLVEGYDAMHFDISLNKPFLRKEMEAKLKDICEGRRTKNDVLQESLVMYREVFMKANREVNVLVDVWLIKTKLTSDMSAIPTE